jgi:hypothetical protein
VDLPGGLPQPQALDVAISEGREVPTTAPELLMPFPALFNPPGSVPRSIIEPVVPLGVLGVHRNAWNPRVPLSGDVSAWPVTWPPALSVHA